MAGTVAAEEVALDELPGVGPGLRQAILRRFRTPSAFMEALREADLQSVCDVDGISERRAVELVRHVRGQAADDTFLATPVARRIHDDILARIQQHAATRHGRNRLRLLDLLDDPEAAQERMRHVLRAKEEVAGMDTARVRRLLAGIRPLRQPTPRCDTETQVVAADPDDRDALRAAGIGAWAMVVAPDEVDPGSGLVLVADGTELGLEQTVDVSTEAPVHETVPWSVLAWVEQNRSTLEACRDLARLMGRPSRAGEALAATDGVTAPALDEAGVRAAVETVRGEADQAIEARAAGLSLSGSEILSAVGSGRLPKALDAVVQKALQKARATLQERTGLSFQPLLPGLPVQVDDDELERVLHQRRAASVRERHEAQVKAARTIVALQEELAAEVAAWTEYDADFALGCFALQHDLQAWSPGEALSIDAGLHLALPSDAQPVSYHLGDEHRVALLTGANSGGKSTLLELIAQAVVLARLGLPTPGTCTVPWLDELHVVAARQGMDAGAFETFLRAFLPTCRGDARRLVLADEVESMTELEAAGRILGHFVGRLAATRSLGVIVTHMAKHVLEHTDDVRIDGIEATGLDDDHRLVVDRQPRIGHLARSTPELIVERLARTARGHDASLYADLLTALRDPETRK